MMKELERDFFAEWRDPETRIAAFELRERGIEISDSVPDCAHVSRDSIVIEIDNITISEDKMYTFNYKIIFTEPFEWIEITMTKKDGEK